MKKVLIVTLLLSTVLTGCTKYKQVIIHGYHAKGIEDVSFERGSLSAKAILELDVENPATVDYSLDSLTATLYKKDGSRFAGITLGEAASVAKLTRDTLELPLLTQFSNPLAILSSGILSAGKLDPSLFLVDLDLDITAGRIKRHIKKDAVPLDQLAEILNNLKNENN